MAEITTPKPYIMFLYGEKTKLYEKGTMGMENYGRLRNSILLQLLLVICMFEVCNILIWFEYYNQTDQNCILGANT